MFRLNVHALAGVLSASAIAAGPAAAQTLDIFPSYRSNGPDGDYFEVYQDEVARYEFAYPGLTHEQSLADPGAKAALLLYGAVGLTTPLPIPPVANLWIDPFKVKLLVVPPTLELEIPWPLGFTPEDAVLTAQAATVEVLPGTAVLYTSDPIEIVYVPPPTQLDDSMVPQGALDSGTQSLTFDPAQQGYFLSFDDGVDPVQYVIDLNDPRIQKGTIRVRETEHGVWAIQGGGFFYSQGFGVQRLNPQQFENFGTHTLVSHFIQNGEVVLVYLDELPSVDGTTTVLRSRAHVFGLEGRSLKVRALDLDGAPRTGDTYYGFTLGGQAVAPGQPAVPVRIPYMDQIGITMVGNDFFASAFIDLFHSQSQVHNAATFSKSGNVVHNSEEMFAIPNTLQVIPPMDERGWVTVSDTVDDCFVGTSAGRSARADDFDSVVGIAFTGLPIPNKYNDDRTLAEKMVEWGFDRVLAWKFHWMRYGLNRRSSTHAPANPEAGTDQELRDWAAVARAAGWRVALYGDFYSIDQAPEFDDNPNYSEGPARYANFQDAVVGPTGDYSRGFQSIVDINAPGPTAPIYFTRLLSPKRALRHFAREAGLFKNDYMASAADFDVIPIAPPDLIVTGDPGSTQSSNGPIDYDPDSSNDKTIASAINSYKNLFLLAQEALDGPVFGEGSFFNYRTRFDSFYAGYIDGVWRTLSTVGAPNAFGAGAMSEVVIPDYEVNVVLPKMTGLFGMGFYSRFFEENQPVGTGIPLSDLALNELRVTQISYMHNGLMHVTSQLAVGSDFLTDAQMVKEYYTMLSLTDERRTAGQAVVSYRSASGGPWRSLSETIKLGGFDFAKNVVRLQFASGLRVIVNHSTQDVFEAGYQIPNNGWAINNFNTGYRNLSVIDPASGARYDEVLAPGWALGDGNGVPRNFAGAIGTTTDLKLVRFDQPLTISELDLGRVLVQ